MDRPPPERVTAVVVNYRTPQLTLDSLASLARVRSEAPTLNAVVVDNCSGDHSVEQIRDGLASLGADWIEVVEAPVNGGFSRGNNFGIQHALKRGWDPDAIWLLNSDTLVCEGSLAGLCRALAIDEQVGLASPRLEGADGSPQQSCFRDFRFSSQLVRAAATSVVSRLFPNGVVALPVLEERKFVEWTSFASVLIHRTVIDAVGGLDEQYFMYFEDADFCREARSHGFRILHEPAARTIHLVGKSSDAMESAKAKRRLPRYWFESRNRYYAKWYGGYRGVVAANLAWHLGRCVSGLREVLEWKPTHLCEKEAWDIWIKPAT